MAVVTSEKLLSRDQSYSVDGKGRYELRYNVIGSNDDAEIRTYLEGMLPAYAGGFIFQGYTLTPVGDLIWEATATYGPLEPLTSAVITFDTTGETAHITQSLETVGSYAPTGEVAPDFQGAIGVTKDSVNGVDIVIPGFSWTETHVIDATDVTTSYVNVLRNLTGTTNDAEWKGYQAGEVLFLGATGSKRNADEWEITFKFKSSPNESGLVVGDITGIYKKGFEYLWVRYIEDVDDDADAIIMRPQAVYIEQVYKESDFALLLIGS